MNIRKKFKTKRYRYSYGSIYDPETGDKLKCRANSVYCRESMAWIMTYQQSKEDIPMVIRIVFVD